MKGEQVLLDPKTGKVDVYKLETTNMRNKARDETASEAMTSYAKRLANDPVRLALEYPGEKTNT